MRTRAASGSPSAGSSPDPSAASRAAAAPPGEAPARGARACVVTTRRRPGHEDDARRRRAICFAGAGTACSLFDDGVARTRRSPACRAFVPCIFTNASASSFATGGPPATPAAAWVRRVRIGDDLCRGRAAARVQSQRRCEPKPQVSSVAARVTGDHARLARRGRQAARSRARSLEKTPRWALAAAARRHASGRSRGR